MKFKCVATCAATLLAGTMMWAPQAQSASFECTAKSSSNRGWVPERFILTYDEQTLAATARTPVSATKYGEPLAIKTIKRSGGKYRFKLKIEMKSTNGTKVKARYTADLDPQKQKFSLQGSLAGFDNRIHASGPCKRLK